MTQASEPLPPTALAPQAVVERALAASTADDTIAIVTETATANLRWAGNTLTTNGVGRKRTLTVIALTARSGGTAAGVMARSGLRDDQIGEVVAAAVAASRDAAPAEDAQPLVPPGAPLGGDWDAPPASTGIEVLAGFAERLGGAFDAAASAGHRLYGFAEHGVESVFVGTSGGLRLRHDQPTGTVEVNAKSADMSRSAFVGRATRDFSDVDVPAISAELHRRLDWASRRVDLPAGRYETLLPPSAVADLMIYLYWTLNARDAAEGRTVFSAPGGGTRVGERLAALPLTLYSDPAEPGLECAPFVVAYAPGRDSSAFDNGLPLGRTPWIEDGRLAALSQTRHSAELTGLRVTPGVDNLVLARPGAAESLDEMVARTERGLLLTCLWYIREVDPQTLLLTGLTRDGVYLVEGGEVTGAVNNFRFNESPVGLLDRITEAGATVPALSREWGDYFTRTAMPPVRVPDFNMSTVSQAS
ncbi:metallopeptidase TldD-related protein [Allonocardiopsis opalescens]|uniref:Putative Zn-dependent protease n=1 Tax=Allonocardiopsis opalescens TaxID=1144618 RepID=A0A2T0Q4C1_9ACTN|nr:metallopeptidase TldD-related protein [Allonocardiopsis opalescens]PRX98619.1 putative Zn-dependent protease [Allonocardiopsis opalescens]